MGNDRWTELPDDLRWYISRLASAIAIQTSWRCYRTRVLVGRFRMLRHIRVFAAYNHSIHVFMLRSRL